MVYERAGFVGIGAVAGTKSLIVGLRIENHIPTAWTLGADFVALASLFVIPERSVPSRAVCASKKSKEFHGNYGGGPPFHYGLNSSHPCYFTSSFLPMSALSSNFPNRPTQLHKLGK